MQIEDNVIDKNNFSSVVFSKINIKRNIDKYQFVKLMTEESKKKIELEVINFVNNLNYESLIYDVGELESNQKKEFLDEDLIDNEFYKQKNGKFIVLNDHISILLNDHDHLSIFVKTRNLSLDKAYNEIESVEGKLGKQFPFAVSTRYGYLTTSIKDCGLGMKIYVLVHLYGLTKMNRLNETLKLFKDRGYLINKWNYDNKNNDKKRDSDYYIISSNLNFGVSETSLVNRFSQGIENLIELNQIALFEYYNNNKDKLVDIIFRSYGLLKYAHSMSYEEALDNLSNLRIGLELKLDIPLLLDSLNKLFVKVKDGYVNKFAEEEDIENDKARAKIIKSCLS